MHQHKSTSQQKLKKTGLRRTKALLATLEFFEANVAPVTVGMILEHLHGQGILANKTTIYRQLEQLKNHEIILEIDFGDLQKRYELACDDHHHHVICTQCGDILDVKLSNELFTEEVRIAKETGFVIERHALEFFGRCPTCQD